MNRQTAKTYVITGTKCKRHEAKRWNQAKTKCQRKFQNKYLLKCDPGNNFFDFF